MVDVKPFLLTCVCSVHALTGVELDKHAGRFGGQRQTDVGGLFKQIALCLLFETESLVGCGTWSLGYTFWLLSP